LTDYATGPERRMVVQKLIAWRGACGDDGSIPVKDAIEGVFAEVAPLSFVVEVSDDAESKITSIGSELKELNGADVTGQTISSIELNSFIGQMLQSLTLVINKKVPATVGGEFEKSSKEKIIYRCILMPLSAASEKINIVLGAVSFKTE